MNYKTLILTFFILTHVQTSHTFEIWEHIQPFVAVTLSYLKFFAEYFIPATRKDLLQAKKEILANMTQKTEEMEKTTNANIDRIFDDGKKELEEKIDGSIVLGTQSLAKLCKSLATTKKNAAEHIRKNYNHLMNILRYKIELQMQTNQNNMSKFVFDIFTSNDSRHQETLLKFVILEEALKKIKKKNKFTHKKTQLLLQQNNEKQRKNFTARHQKFSDDTKRLQQSFILNKETLEQLSQKIGQIKKNNAINKETSERIIAITNRYKALIQKNSPNPGDQPLSEISALESEIPLLLQSNGCHND